MIKSLFIVTLLLIGISLYSQEKKVYSNDQIYYYVDKEDNIVLYTLDTNYLEEVSEDINKSLKELFVLYEDYCGALRKSCTLEGLYLFMKTDY